MKKRKNRKRLITRQIKRGSLIRYAIDNIKKESFSVITRELKDVLKNYAGIYALYKGDKLVRVGLGTNIYYRVKGHSKSKKLKWDNASLFIVRNIKYLRDLETAIVRIAKPEYNDIKGRVGDEHYIERILKRKVKEKRRKLRHKRTQKDKELKTLKKDIEKIERVVG